jgi:heme/copper-type cytochrome/quinol oxidase subunit 4
VPSDLAWRRAQLAAADSIDIASRVFGGSLLAVANLLGLGLFAVALVAVARDGSGILASDPLAMPTLVAALGVACGLVLVARVRTRSLGALWAAGSAPVILIVGLQLLAQHTTLLFFTTQSAPLWTVGQLAAAVCVAVFYLAAAVWWMPERKKVFSR